MSTNLAGQTSTWSLKPVLAPNWSINKMKQRRSVHRELYVSELAAAATGRMKRVPDPGVLQSPRPQAIGMDKMYTSTSAGKFIVEALNSASLHGLNQIVAPRRHTCERFLVIFIIIGALGALIAMSMDSWRRYSHEATLVVLDNNFRKFEISKPSITICPINIIDEDKFPEVLKSIVELPIDADFTAVPAELWLQLLVELRGNVEVESLYSGERYDWVSTERGLCIMLASPISRDISVYNWLSNKTSSSQRKQKIKKSYYNMKNFAATGSITCKTHEFWMSVHHPDTVIDHTTSGLIIRGTSLNSLTLEIVEVSSSASAARLPVGHRNCKLPTDGGLDTWPIYTQRMCELECRFKLAIKVCGCLPHFAKPMEGIPTCNARQLVCIANHEEEVVHLKGSKLKRCGCLSDCNEAIYVDKEYTSFRLNDDSPPDAIINLHLDFPQVKYIRDELFSFSDFLASIGGAAGFFLGASVLSVCEILYFASLRLLVYLVEEKRKENKINELLRGYK
ncbi:uncharacterized protein LOC131670765 [Phymastichus coffea]|uniref:uncharacterized protein LOC131670765 n=1 Tax=Phymastichus coffea TaxID=108790 RepID=UPI00273C25ED|nr:uncharacterized protein LOC131670765 [Phymastichus coffea]